MTRRRRRVIVAAVAAVVVLVVTAVLAVSCSGGDDEPSKQRPAAVTLDTTLVPYKGEGFSVSYPRGWRKFSGLTVVQDAQFEVGVLRSPEFGPESSLDVLVGNAAFPLSVLVDDWLEVGTRLADFKLESKRQLLVSDVIAYEVRTSYRIERKGGGTLPVRQVDVFAVTAKKRLVDVRVTVTADRYNDTAPLIRSIVSSFRPR
ncbi:hypothetical protein [Spirillospora sp. NBC_01491]|uniref:hypothetical protein n=1 Tax=Spirillospora sp. NBC_01491 TaxID=2976007 RepID=UPI002E30581D|nr:hypothetical protein [Spirillospora sp. NBC_01491]